MKKLFILLICLPGLPSAKAQTVLTAAMNQWPVGTTDSVSSATGIAPGNAGNGVTWDFSNVSLTSQATVRAVDPATTPYAGTFPSATHALELKALGSTAAIYEFTLKNNTGVYIVASNYSAATPTDNYTPNTKLRIPFPFSFGNSITDTFQKVGRPLDAYTITYDGFGTLKTPRGTYSNVIRLKYVWIGGEVAYNWYSTAPLGYLATWGRDNGGTLTVLGGSAATGVQNEAQRQFEVFPNPATETVHLRMPVGYTAQNTLSCTLYDVTGRAVRTINFENGEAMLRRQQLPAGGYYYEVREATRCVGRGRLVFE